MVFACGIALAKEYADSYRNIEDQVSQRTSELNGALGRIQELEESKSRFFGNISHDLRTPLAAAIAALHQYPGEIQQSPVSKTIRGQLQKELGLIDELIKVAKSESVQVFLRYQQVRVAGLLKRLWEMFTPLAREKGLTLEVNGEVPPPLHWPMDARQMERVLQNLINNAIKYTKAGTVKVEARQVGEEWLSIAVSDTGQGIPKEDQQRIFKRYERGSQPTDQPGYGIGLSFVKETVEAHGGKIGVESQPGRGTTFTVLLLGRPPGVDLGKLEVWPEAEEESNAASREGEAEAYPRDEITGRVGRPVVAVAEDNPVLAGQVVALLKDEYDILFGENGLKALHKIRTARRVDCLITDLRMPVMGGEELIVELRKDPQTARLPIIVLTSQDEIESVEARFREGATDYLVKPYYPPVFKARVRSQIALAKAQKQTVDLEKMAALGQLTAGINHEIKNPIGFVQGYAGAVIQYFEGLKELAEGWEKMSPEERERRIAEVRQQLPRRIAAAEKIRTGLDRVNEIIRAMKEYSSGEARPDRMKLADALERALLLLGDKLKKKGIEVVKEIPAEAVINGYMTLNQVFVNLIDNAIDAVPESGGRIEIRGERRADGVAIAVKDNGCGIAAEHLEQVFHPFFTKKEQGQGTGLGLFIVHSIVTAQHGGNIEVRSAPGAGAEFSFFLPYEAPPPKQEKILLHGMPT